jgi:hypothetical protein
MSCSTSARLNRNGADHRCRMGVSPTGGISVAGSTPAMWRAKPRATVIRRGHRLLPGSTCGALDQATAAAMVIVDAPISSR